MKQGRKCTNRTIQCICGNVLSIQGLTNHIKKVHGIVNIPEFNKMYYDILYKDINIEILIEDYIGGQSIPDICEKYKLFNHDIQFILKYNCIYKRTNSESKKTKQYIEKIANTNIERYGCSNPSSNDDIKQKKIDTMLKNYNRINNFSDSTIKQKAFENIDYEKLAITHRRTLLKKYGVEKITDIPGVSEKISKTHKYNWNFIYDEDKLDTMVSNLLEARKKVKYQRISKLELRIKEILDDFDIEYKSNIFIKKYNFDLVFNDKIILEINGDYWHANPRIYKETDLLRYPGNIECEAKVIWNRDKNKKEYIENFGYKVYYIWENELKNMSNIEVLGFIINIIG